MNAQTANPFLKDKIKQLEKEESLISDKRKSELQELANVISEQLAEQNDSKVVFVCTHNSRRSQLSELWFRAAVNHYRVKGISAYSGGTEATAFNKRMVDAVLRSGFYMATDGKEENPTYFAKLSNGDPVQVEMFSKKFDDPFNPQADFIAVMVCGQADRDCPYVPGAYARVSLPYVDPKVADDSPNEAAVYDAKVREIGREILYLARLLDKES